MERSAAGADDRCVRDSRLSLVFCCAVGVVLGGLFLVLGLGLVRFGQVDKTPPASKTGCPGADTATRDVRNIDEAVLCLHNVERRDHGRGSLRWDRDLARAGSRHARDMVARSYFAHVSPGGKDQMDRVAAGGYPFSAGCWTAGENLYFASGPVTPRQLLKAWMASPAHRANILHRGWRDFGLGVTAGSPRGQGHGLTVVALLAVRSQRSCGARRAGIVH